MVRRRRSRALSTLLLSVTAAVALSQPASAHNYAPCGDGIPMKYVFPNAYYYIGGSWNSTQKAAVNAAAGSISSTDFDWWLDSVQYEVLWGNLNSSDTSVAGFASWINNCSTHKITASALYLNFPHFSGSHSTSQSAYQCAALHEFGHIMTLEHNSVTSMMKQPHTSRCHNGIIIAVTSHDRADIDAKYP